MIALINKELVKIALMLSKIVLRKLWLMIILKNKLSKMIKRLTLVRKLIKNYKNNWVKIFKIKKKIRFKLKKI